MSDRRHLVLLRHAKSDYPPGVIDVDRPLAARGRREAAIAGADILAQVGAVDQVLCSAAERTRQTLAHAGIDAPTDYLPAIYEAAPSAILAAIGEADPAAETLLVVGHAPGIPGLAWELADEESDQRLLAALGAHFPTSAFAVLTTTLDWSDLGPGTARLTGFTVSRP